MSDSNFTFKFCKTCDCETLRSPSGLCKPCNKLAVAKYRKENAEKIKTTRKSNYRKNNNTAKATEATMRSRRKNMERFQAYQREYRKANKERIREQQKLWALINPESKRESGIRYREKNKEEAKERSAEWRKNNKEKALNLSRTYYAKNAEKLRACSSARKKANRSAYIVYGQNRNAKKRINGGKLSKGLSEKLYQLQKGKCACCKKPLGEDYHLDHIMPIALGGLNIDENIQLLRKQCNMQKHAKHPVDFMQSKGFLL